MLKHSILFVSIFFVTGCDILNSHREEGHFNTDQVMTEFLVNNISEFNTLVELKDYCNEFYAPNGNDLIVHDDCKSIFDSLGLVYVQYYGYYDVNNYFVEKMLFKTYEYMLDNGIYHKFIKGYQFNYNSNNIMELWNDNLSTPPKEECENYSSQNYYRMVEINDVRLMDKWYLYAIEICD